MPIPPRLEKVAEVGGWEERKKQLAMEKLMDAMAKPKTQKAATNTEKMFKAIKASGDTIISVLDAFTSAGSGSNVFKSVVEEYSNYLSLTFWGEIMQSIDWSSITTVISDVLAPIFSEIGTTIGDLIEEAPVGTAIGGGIGLVLGSFVGNPMIGAIIGAAIGGLIESFYNQIAVVIDEAPPEAPYQPSVWQLYEEQTGKKYTTIFDPNYVDWYNNVYLPSLGASPPPGRTGGVQELQGGTDAVTRSGIFGLHAGEAVSDANEMSLQTSVLEEIRDLQKAQLRTRSWEGW